MEDRISMQLSMLSWFPFHVRPNSAQSSAKSILDCQPLNYYFRRPRFRIRDYKMIIALLIRFIYTFLNWPLKD